MLENIFEEKNYNKLNKCLKQRNLIFYYYFQFDYFDNFEVLKNFSFIIEFILNYKKAYDLIL